MSIVKDLLTKEEQRSVHRMLEILPEDAPLCYEVWAIGYHNRTITGTAFLLKVFIEPEDAIEYAKTEAPQELRRILLEADLTEFNAVALEVETVIDDNEEGTINICTLYKKMFIIKS
jgi:hypothetical protein